jgi:diguanylate cyclase (GGDEF)-like protein/PAS domain S-box-containing protein
MQPSQEQPAAPTSAAVPPVADPQREFRAELTLAFGVFEVLVCTFSAVTELIWGTPGLGELYAAAVPILIGLIVWLQRGGDPSRAGMALMIVAFAIVTATNLSTGGRALGANIALPTIALLGVLMSSPRVALLWVALVLLEIVVMAVLRRGDLDFPLYPHPDWVKSAIDRVPLIFSIGSALIGWMMLRALDRHRARLEQLRAAEAVARTQAAASADRFADFASISADGFWETDAELRLTYVSPGFAQAMGLDAGQMLGLTPEQAYRLRFPQVSDLGEYTAPLQQRQPFSNQRLSTLDQSGKARWLLNQGQPRFDDRGEFLGYRGTVRDVSAEVIADKARRASEQRLRLITDHVPALISYIDSERRFRFNNRLYGIWLNRPLEQITGRLVSEVYEPEIYAMIEPHIEAAFGGEQQTFELMASTRFVRVTYIPDVDDSGRVVGIYGLIHDITKLKQVESELRMLAQFDPLTGLANRRRFVERLDEAIARSERSGQLMALLFLDLDRFKAINDSLGHKAGDLVLQQFARRIEQCVRRTDSVARLAGDEFVVILEALSEADEARVVARKILDAMGEPFDLEGVSRRITTSIGIAVREPGETDGEALLRRADAALYEAKAAGRGAFSLAQ